MEKYDSIDNGYNIMRGGSHGKHSEDTKAKLRQIQSDTKTKEIQADKRRLYWANHPEEKLKLVERNKSEVQRNVVKNARTGQPHPHKGTSRKGIKWGKNSTITVDLKGQV